MSGNRKEEVEAAVKDVDFSKNKYQIELDTTAGKITINLNGDVAPGHCKNMIGLAKIGDYDGVLFHRIIKGFMIQGGCPLGTGTGGPGYTIKAEFNTTPHEAGVLSMAAPNSFFVWENTRISTVNTPPLVRRPTRQVSASFARSAKSKPITAIGPSARGPSIRPRP